MIQNISILQVLPFAQFVSSNQKIRTVSSDISFLQNNIATYSAAPAGQLALTHSVTSNISGRSNSDSFILLSAVSVSKVNNLDVSHILSFGDGGNKSYFKTLISTLNLSQYARIGQVDNLTLSQQVDVFKSNSTSNELVFTQSLLANVIRTFNIISQLELISDPDPFFPDVNFIAIPLPSLTYLNNITLTNNGSITLRSPEFGNTDKLEHARISKKNRGGNYIIHRESYWPKSEFFSYTIKALKQKKVRELLEFHNNNLGQEVILRDYENQSWRVILLDPTKECVQTGIDFFETNLEMQVLGEAVTPKERSFIQNLIFTQDVGFILTNESSGDQTISLGQDVGITKVINRSVLSNLTFGHSSGFGSTVSLSLSVTSTIAFSQNLPTGINLSQSLTLAQNLSHVKMNATSGSSSFALSQSIVLHKVIFEIVLQ